MTLRDASALMGRSTCGHHPSSTSVAPPLKIEQRLGLVTLTATMTDRGGRPIMGLKQTGFRVYEDFVPQPVSVFEVE